MTRISASLLHFLGSGAANNKTAPPEEQPVVPFVLKPRHSPQAEPRTATSGSKPASSRSTSAQSPTPAKLDGERKPLQGRQRDNAETRSQESSHNRTNTATEQAVHARREKDQQDKGKGGGHHGAAAVQNAVAANAAQDIACIIDDLAPMCANEGVFELLLPDGEHLGVAVSIEGARVGLLLNPGTGRLAERLRKRQRELKEGLEQRMGKDVTITVL